MSEVLLKHEVIEINHVAYAICSLKDNQQFDHDDLESVALGIGSATWSLFGVVWPTSIVMALSLHKLPMAGKRVLEIGCGIGLCSIVLHRMGVDITASDYHPQTQAFLERNILGNDLEPIKYQTGNWETENLNLGQFDYVIGSDILYQPAHAKDVSRFIDRHSNQSVQILIGDPGRANRAHFTREMSALGYSYNFETFDETPIGGKRCKGRMLHFERPH